MFVFLLCEFIIYCKYAISYYLVGVHLYMLFSFWIVTLKVLNF